VEATSSASVRPSASGALGSVWTTANTEYPKIKIRPSEKNQKSMVDTYPPFQPAGASYPDIIC
jgi:hypothetical protein